MKTLFIDQVLFTSTGLRCSVFQGRGNKYPLLTFAVVAVLLGIWTGNAQAVVETEPLLPPSLKTVPVPEPANLALYVKDKNAAIALGKALFWDAQAGSDGMACASCHYHAGADHRTKNQINPGSADVDGRVHFDLAYTQVLKQYQLDSTGKASPAQTAGPNIALAADDFPLHRLVDPYDRNSEVVFDTNDIVGSQGVFKRNLLSIAVSGKESCKPVAGMFNVAGVGIRQATGRNAPSVINAVYNYRNFWDGRAVNRFNGLDPFGDRRPFDPKSTNNILSYDAKTKTLVPVHVQIDDASLASQAVGPALSSGEMNCAGELFRYLGRKMLATVPLKNQKVDSTDSVLGSYAATGNGFKTGNTYTKMIQAAFQPAFWGATSRINGYSQIEHNFSLFWGLAIQLYEATLVSNDSPYDQYKENPYDNSLTAQQVSGMNLFAGKGMCMSCHRGAEFTAATKTHVTDSFLERMRQNDTGIALYDTGFYNIGVRPTVEDLGLGGKDGYGNPLSFTRNAKALADGGMDGFTLSLDPVTIDSANFKEWTGTPVMPDERDATDGAFKTPGLRNIELTGPYFHNGGYGTLRQTIEFYNRGGDRVDTDLGDSSGFADNASNLAPDMAGGVDPLYPHIHFPTLGLLDTEMDDLVEFLKTLTDERVRWEKAPFDHPSLPLPTGAKGSNSSVTPIILNPLEAQDEISVLPAVGAGGRSAKKLPPLGEF